MIGGVARGFADSLGVSDWIPRVFFVVTAFMGGFGVALYAACWAFIRAENEEHSPAERFFSGASSSRSWVGIAFMVVAGIIILSNFTFLAGEVVWALAFLVVGLLLYLGYIPGTPRSTPKPSESKEGVQPVTTTQTLTTQVDDDPSGDSPAGGPPASPTPTPPEPSPAQPREHSILGRLTIGAMLLAMGGLAVLDTVVGINIGPRHYLALAVTVVGVGLLVGSVVGRARWLILVGAVLVPTLLFSPLFDSGWRWSGVDRYLAPVEIAEVETSYQADLGSLVIDLTQLPWDGEEIPVDIRMSAGSVRLYLPDEVGIVGTARVDVGRVWEPGRSSAGISNPALTWDEPGELGTVLLEARVDVGEIRIDRWR